VISPSERAAADTQAKLEAYLRHGTQEVWQVFPKSKSVVIHRGAASTLLATGEHITTPLLNGFSLDPATLFQNNE
jgi:Uma2 family endonuclease